GLKDILIPYNLVGPIKVERLLRLVRRARVTVSVDSEETARGIAAPAHAAGLEVPVLLELDTGMQRCGVQSPAEAQALARTLVELRGLRFEGLMTYPSAERARPFLDETRERLRRDGIPVARVSGGGTGHEEQSKALG